MAAGAGGGGSPCPGPGLVSQGIDDDIDWLVRGGGDGVCAVKYLPAGRSTRLQHPKASGITKGFRHEIAAMHGPPHVPLFTSPMGLGDVIVRLCQGLLVPH